MATRNWHKKADLLSSEYVIAAEGMVKLRDAETINAAITTGEVEMVVEKLWILNESRTPPFPMEEHVDVKEETRLKYRYVDLRRPHMQRNIILRSKVAFAVRKTLAALGFLEIETPFMTRSTPEGARDYLVPARVYPGHFYALPQSPQIFKQLLMVSGFDKYFQIVSCFRDEDFRADRQAEFTQIDLEMSFPQQETIFEVIEPLIQAAWKEGGYEVPIPFPRMTYAESMRSYGNDKPDLRLPPFYCVEDLLPELTANGLPLVAIRIPKVGAISRSERDGLKEFGKERGLRVFDDPKRLDKDYPEAMKQVRDRIAFAETTICCCWRDGAGEPKGQRPEETVLAACGHLRLHAANKYADRHNLFDPKNFKFTVGARFPDVRMGRGREPLERGASSVHFGA